MKDKLDNIFEEKVATYKLYDSLQKEKEAEVLKLKESIKTPEDLEKNFEKIEPIAFEAVRTKFEASELLREITVLMALYKHLGEKSPEVKDENITSVNRDTLYSYVYNKEHNILEEREKGIMNTHYKLTKNSEGYKEAVKFFNQQNQSGTTNKDSTRTV